MANYHDSSIISKLITVSDPLFYKTDLSEKILDCISRFFCKSLRTQLRDNLRDHTIVEIQTSRILCTHDFKNYINKENPFHEIL